MLDSKKILVGVTVGVAATAATFGSVVVTYELANKHQKKHFSKMLQPSTETLRWLTFNATMTENDYKVFAELSDRHYDLHFAITDFHDLRRASEFYHEINTFIDDLDAFAKKFK